MITIYKNPNGDTRTASKDVTFEEFQEANTSHINDVRNAMDYISDLVLSAGEFHDCTKKTQEKMFYRDFKNTLETGANFIDGEWYQLHITAERHHIDHHCPEDVNLIDILEMIADRVCAGMSRSGQIYDIDLPNEVLQRAVKNTTQMLIDRVEVLDPPKPKKLEVDPNKLVNIDPINTQVGDTYPFDHIGDFPLDNTPVIINDGSFIPVEDRTTVSNFEELDNASIDPNTHYIGDFSNGQ